MTCLDSFTLQIKTYGAVFTLVLHIKVFIQPFRRMYLWFDGEVFVIQKREHQLAHTQNTCTSLPTSEMTTFSPRISVHVQIYICSLRPDCQSF